METLGTHGSTPSSGTPIGYPSPTNLSNSMQRRQSGDDEPMSDNEFSRDGDSPDVMARVPESDVDPETLDKLRRQEREEREEIERELKAQSLSLAQSDNNGNTTSGGLSLKDTASLGGLAGLEAFRREYLTSPLSHLRSSLPHNFPPLLPHSTSVMTSIAESSFGKLHSSAPPSASSTGSNTPPALSADRSMPPRSPSQHRSPSSEFTSQQNWSFEEQFKQLYELSDDSKRKDFLDDLFAFMQKRGTPINRLPIMAKQVLDLYELYNLVIARGGLVEVINKKQWQEIIKGLNLPSSITSAAFTLRTQYTKYLYPYECHMKNLSSPNELQQAIDGNRREGRRSGYDSYPHMFPGPRPTMPLPPTSLSLPQISPLPPGMRPHSFNGTGFPGNISNVLGGKSPPPGMNHTNPLSALEMTRLALFKMYNQAGLPPPPLRDLPGHPPGLTGLDVGRAMAEQQARAFQAVREAEEGRREKERHEQESRAVAALAAAREMEKEREHRQQQHQEQQQQQQQQHQQQQNNHEQKENHRKDKDRRSSETHLRDEDSALSPPPMKRERRDSLEDNRRNGSPMGGANIRISSRGESGESSLVVTLEINSVMYQGVLFAQPKKNSNSGNSHSKESSKETRISS